MHHDCAHAPYTQLAQAHPNHIFTPRSPAVFWWAIRAAGIRFVVDYNPTRCPLHMEGPQNELDLAGLEAEYTGSDAGGKKALVKALQQLRKQVETYKRHLKQYEVSRSLSCTCPQLHRRQVMRVDINTDISDLVDEPGDAVIIEDFVARYDAHGPPLSRESLIFNIKVT